jgi:hypothetical protein
MLNNGNGNLNLSGNNNININILAQNNSLINNGQGNNHNNLDHMFNQNIKNSFISNITKDNNKK